MITALEAALRSGYTGVLHGHMNGVFAIAIARDGRTLASGSADGTVRLWDARSHRPIGAALTSQGGFVYDVAFSPDGHLLASAGSGGRILLWKLAARPVLERTLVASPGRPKPATGRPKPATVQAIVFRDERTLYSGDDRGDIRVWRLDAREKPSLPIRGAGHVDDLAISRDGTELASAARGGHGRLRLWDLRRARPLGSPAQPDPHPGYFGLAFSAEGTTVASAGSDGAIRLWDAHTGQERASSPLVKPSRDNRAYAVAYSDDGRTLASAGADKAIRLWDLPGYTPQPGTPLRGHTAAVFDVAFSRDGQLLAAASDDTTVTTWKARGRVPFGSPWLERRSRVLGIAFRPSIGTLASVGAYTRVYARTGKQLSSSPRMDKPGQAVAFSRDGDMIASAEGDRTVRLGDADRPEARAPLPDPPSAARAVAFSKSGRTLASGGANGTIRLWDTRTRAAPGTLLVPRRDAGWPVVEAVAFNPNDEHVLASADSGGAIRLWDVKRRREVGLLKAGGSIVHAIAFSPDGHTLAWAGEDTTITLWDVETRKTEGELAGHTHAVYSLAFSPDSRTLASAGRDDTIRLWHVDDRPLGARLAGGVGRVEGVAFSPDGQTLAVAGLHGIRFWRGIFWPSADALRERICALVGSGLSGRDWAQYSPRVGEPRTCP